MLVGHNYGSRVHLSVSGSRSGVWLKLEGSR